MMNLEVLFERILKKFLHDPIDKCLDIHTHEERAKEYAELVGVSGVEDVKGPDQIASCMERSLLPEGIIQKFNEIRHPFSEEGIRIEGIDKNAVFDAVKRAFNTISEEIKNFDDKKKFLYLRRNLMENILKELENSPFKKYIPLLPADPRAPDHSIWEHIKIASAINASENFQNNSLFLFTIGPVQSFIAQARKTQDLFMGSFLLSYLSFTAMEEIIENYGPTNIIYPDLFSQPLMDFYLEKEKGLSVKNSYGSNIDQPTIPNRFVAIIPESDGNEIRKLAEDISKKVKDEWRKIVNAVLKEFKLDNHREVQSHIFPHTKDFPEIYWVSIPFKIGTRDIEINDLKDFFENIEPWQNLWVFAKEHGEFPPNIGLLYQPAYTSLEKSMGSRKNLRDFEQIEEKGKKCHLCGEREGVIKKGMGDLEVGKYMGDTEGLCVLCFTKRALDKYLETKSGKFKDFSFPSTAEVASTDFKERAITHAKGEFKEYVEKFREVIGKDKFREVIVKPLPKIKDKFNGIKNLEGYWFFEENLTKNKFEKELGLKDVTEKDIENLKDKLQKIYEKVGKPNPYYAVIMFDADNMGRWLSGELLPAIEYAYNANVWKNFTDDFKDQLNSITNNKKILTPAIHASISTALRNYSIEFVRKIVEEEHYGRLIYAGGDDVLALVNVNDLFEVMRKLRAGFSGQIRFENGSIKVDWKETKGFVEKDGKLLLTIGKNATASCGVVIAHYKMPLKIVLDKVREMEKKAKEGKKDAFAISLLKHSGEERVGVSKWRYDGFDVLENLREFGKTLKKIDNEPSLSKRFIYHLYEEFKKLKNEKGYFTGKSNIFEVELKRLLGRASHGKNKEEKKKMVTEIFTILNEIFSKIGLNIDNFINLLQITAFVYEREE